VIFSSKEKSAEILQPKISSGIKRKFRFDVEIVIVNPAQIEHILKHNPFTKKKSDSEKLHVIFLMQTPSAENIKKLASIDYSPEEYFIEGKYVYLYVPNGYGKAKLNNNFFENKLKVSGTTRNWRTINALSKLVELH
jgi:uncharacterized protein (DUF1697 family)